MSSLPRIILIVGALIASVSLADAGDKAASEIFPSLGSLGAKPLTASVPEAGAAIVAAETTTRSRRAVRLARRGPRSRFARETRTARFAREDRSARMTAAAEPAPSTPVQTASLAPAEVHGTLPPAEEQAAKTPGEIRAASPTVDGPHERGAPTLADLIAKHAQENGVPVELAQAVVRIESRGNAHAAHGGALGLMQIKPGTARAAGFSGGASSLFVAETNLHFGMKILGQAYRSAGGNLCRALMQYQSGHLATRMSRANQAYCSRARAVMAGA